MATKKLNSISNEFSESENDISTNELIKNIQIIANSTQILSDESESEVDEEAWLSYMEYLKKNILKESSPIEKRRKHLDELTLETDEELMLKNQNYVTEFDNEDPDELIQEIEKHLNESFFSTISSNPQGSSSPKELQHKRRSNSDSLYETMSSRIYNCEDSSLENRSESIGYHSFKPEHKNHLLSFTKIMDKLESNTFNKINPKTDSIVVSDSEEEEQEQEDTKSSPIIISLLSSTEDEDADDEDDHYLKSIEENNFNECKTDEISLKLTNLKVAAVKPNITTESQENRLTPASPVKIISNELISKTVNDEPLKILRPNPFKTSLESNTNPSPVKIISNELISKTVNDEPLKVLRPNPFKTSLESNINPSPVNIISNELISKTVNDEPLKVLRHNPFKTSLESNNNLFQPSLESNNTSTKPSKSNPFQSSLESNNNPFQPSLESNNTAVKLSRKQRRKLRKRQIKKTKKAELKPEQQNSCLNTQNTTERSPETEIELPSGKRTKLNDKGTFLSKTSELIKINKETRRNKLKASKYIKFISGGIVKFGTKDNNLNITNQLKLNQKNLTDDKEYKIELAKILNTIGGEIIIKLGYEVGKGLGKTLQGIQRPIEAYIRKGRGSIGKYGSEMSLPTSIKIQEKQYKILKALGKSELDLEEENKNKSKNKKEPGIYSAVNFDYANLKYSESKNFEPENNNEIMVDPLSNEKYSNIIIQFHNDNIENNNDETTLRQSNQLKKIRKIINCELLQLCIFDETSHLYSYQLQELKNNLEKLIINAVMHCNINCLQFESCYIDNTNGCLLLNCTNEITYDWIENLLCTSSAVQNFLPNVNLVIKNFRKSLQLAHKMEIFIPSGENLMTIEYLKILENQNPGLQTKKWKIYKRNDLRDSVNLILGITEESYKVLEFNYNFRPYMGLGRIKFYPIDL